MKTKLIFSHPCQRTDHRGHQPMTPNAHPQILKLPLAKGMNIKHHPSPWKCSLNPHPMTQSGAIFLGGKVHGWKLEVKSTNKKANKKTEQTTLTDTYQHHPRAHHATPSLLRISDSPLHTLKKRTRKEKRSKSHQAKTSQAWDTGTKCQQHRTFILAPFLAHQSFYWMEEKDKYSQQQKDLNEWITSRASLEATGCPHRVSACAISPRRPPWSTILNKTHKTLTKHNF